MSGGISTVPPDAELAHALRLYENRRAASLVLLRNVEARMFYVRLARYPNDPPAFVCSEAADALDYVTRARLATGASFIVTNDAGNDLTDDDLHLIAARTLRHSRDQEPAS